MSKEYEFYKKLKQSLEETTTFPTDYMYKFIIPASKEKFALIENVFNNLGAVIKSKSSKTGKYTSLTILVRMKSSSEIITIYKKVSKVEGVISL
jgi:putative lipoic acid-binding regulatory protein